MEAVAFARRGVAGFLALAAAWAAAGLDLAAAIGAGMAAAIRQGNRLILSKHDKTGGKVLHMGTGGAA